MTELGNRGINFLVALEFYVIVISRYCRKPLNNLTSKNLPPDQFRLTTADTHKLKLSTKTLFVTSVNVAVAYNASFVSRSWAVIL